MKWRCLFGHSWRELPRFKPRNYEDRFTLPSKICTRCFKEYRKPHVMIIESAEGPGLGYHMPPHWEGQPVPEGYDSWADYHKEARDKLLRSIRAERR